MNTNRTLIIVPTYNERGNIGRLIEHIEAKVPSVDILVVDDNSPDGTRDIVKQLMRHSSRLHLLERPGKQGLGVAYISGFNWGIKAGYQQFIQMDADFSHDPSDLPRMIETLKTSDVVVGSRYIEGGGTSGWPLFRRIMSRGGSMYARFILGLPYRDLTGGFNGWRCDVLKQIKFHEVSSVGYAFQIEMKLRAHRSNFRITEIPIQFKDREVGKSKMSSEIVREAALRVWRLRELAPVH